MSTRDRSNSQRRRTKRQHLISLSYQKAWADDAGRVAVISKPKQVWYRNDPRNAFTRTNFLSYHDGSDLNDGLETAFGDIENLAMPIVREVLKEQRDDIEARHAAGAMCALHWARSESTRGVYERSLATAHERVTVSDEAIEAFRSEFGRCPAGDEAALLIAKNATESNVPFAQIVQEHYTRFLEEVVDQNHVQLVWTIPGPAAFVAADAPVIVLSDTLDASADRPIQALRANKIWFPLGPTAGMALSTKPATDVRMSQAQVIQANTLSWNYARKLLLASPASGPHNAFGRPRRRLPEEAPQGTRRV